MIEKSLCREIQKLLIDLDMTQSDFSKTLGVNNTNLSLVLNGRKEFPILESKIRKWYLEQVEDKSSYIYTIYYGNDIKNLKQVNADNFLNALETIKKFKKLNYKYMDFQIIEYDFLRKGNIDDLANTKIHREKDNNKNRMSKDDLQKCIKSFW